MTTTAVRPAADSPPRPLKRTDRMGCMPPSFVVGGIRPRQRLGWQARMRAAEVWHRRILPDLDDAAPDRARAREVIVQGLAVAAADRARQRREILIEAAEHLQHGVLVVQEHV